MNIIHHNFRHPIFETLFKIKHSLHFTFFNAFLHVNYTSDQRHTGIGDIDFPAFTDNGQLKNSVLKNF